MWLFVAGALSLALGAVFASPRATLIGGTVLTFLATTLALTIPRARRVRRERLEFAWWLSHGEPGADSGAAIPDKPFDVQCFVRHRGHEPLLLRELVPIVPLGAELVDGDDEHALLDVPPNTRTEFQFRFVAQAAGRVVLHGLAVKLIGPLGLFELPLYFPNPLVIKVMPQAVAGSRRMARSAVGSPIERPGASLLALGNGVELRELRDMQPGDPFRSIAWKASARKGRFLVREVEQEVQETRIVVMDAGGTMRGGALGRRKLDDAIEACAAEARRTLARGDAFGLTIVDGRVLAQLAPEDGSGQLLRTMEALLAATEIVDEDLTEVDDADVMAIVGRYVRQQDGVDFRAGQSDWNVSLLLRHVVKHLEASRSDEAGHRNDGVRASTPTGSLLRRFCKLRGIPLPHRTSTATEPKAVTLAETFRSIAAHTKPSKIAVITDLDELGDPQPMLAAIKLLRGRGFAMTFVVPDGPSFVERPSDRLGNRLYDVLSRGERRRRVELERTLGPLGVRVHRASAGESATTVLARALDGARRGRAA